MVSASTLSDRRGVWAFVLGVIMVTGGVLMHAPMFLMGRHNHFILYGMPIGWDMILGMVAIVAGCESPPTGCFQGTSRTSSQPRRTSWSLRPRTRRSAARTGG